MSISLTLIAISRCLMSLSFQSFLLLCLSFKFCFYIYLYNITNMFHWLGWDQWIEISWEWNYLLFHLNSCWKNPILSYFSPWTSRILFEMMLHIYIWCNCCDHGRSFLTSVSFGGANHLASCLLCKQLRKIFWIVSLNIWHASD